MKETVPNKWLLMVKREMNVVGSAVFRFFSRLSAYYCNKPSRLFISKIFESFCSDVSVGWRSREAGSSGSWTAFSLRSSGSILSTFRAGGSTSIDLLEIVPRSSLRSIRTSILMIAGRLEFRPVHPSASQSIHFRNFYPRWLSQFVYKACHYLENIVSWKLSFLSI